MQSPDELRREIQLLRERISRLSAAVLQEVVDSARALTGAHCGVIVTFDEAGTVRDLIASGFTPSGDRRLAVWTDGRRACSSTSASLPLRYGCATCPLTSARSVSPPTR